MRFLITGGAGFIGSNLCELLLNKDHDLLVIDDLSAGHERNLPRSAKLELHACKVQDFEACKLGQIDGIFHLAAQASVPLSVQHLYESSVNNIQSSLRVLDWARHRNLPVVYATSSAVYGELPFGDDRNDKVDLSSPYAVDKYALEKYAAVAHVLYGTPSIGLRFFNVYGPRQDPGNPYSGVIALFIDRLARNAPITVYGGYQTRDFIFVADVAAVLYRSMTYLQTNGGRSVFNVGTGRSVTIDELLQKLANTFGATPRVCHEALPAGDPAASLGSSERMAQELSLDVTRFTSLETGLLATVRFATSSGG